MITDTQPHFLNVFPFVFAVFQSSTSYLVPLFPVFLISTFTYVENAEWHYDNRYTITFILSFYWLVPGPTALIVALFSIFQINTFAYLENAEWHYDNGYTSTTTMPVCCPQSNAVLVYFNFSFTRLRPFYVINLIIPAMLLSICMVLTFLLPTECGERLGYSLTILLSYTVLMTITTEMMPTTSKETPHIGMVMLYIPD